MIIMSIAVSSKAPDFTLKSSNGPGEKNDFGLSEVTLSANYGEKNSCFAAPNNKGDLHRNPTDHSNS